jgi:hypothetical protein
MSGREYAQLKGMSSVSKCQECWPKASQLLFIELPSKHTYWATWWAVCVCTRRVRCAASGVSPFDTCPSRLKLSVGVQWLTHTCSLRLHRTRPIHWLDSLCTTSDRYSEMFKKQFHRLESSSCPYRTHPVSGPLSAWSPSATSFTPDALESRSVQLRCQCPVQHREHPESSLCHWTHPVTCDRTRPESTHPGFSTGRVRSHGDQRSVSSVKPCLFSETAGEVLNPCSQVLNTMCITFVHVC